MSPSSLDARVELGPLDAAGFSVLMAACGPFERQPELAVAVSGGADSLALCLLSADWARRRGGRVVALTVDHRLRSSSAAEARTLGGWLAARAIAHHCLVWRAAKPATGIQAAARQARYDLLRAWCETHRIPHLLLGHHLEDQAETVLMRLGQGSGADGLAGMTAVSDHRGLRLVRPLLTVPKARLVATLEARRQDWISDPSNGDTAYTRARLRARMPALAAAGLSARGIAETAQRLGRQRAAAERETAGLLARAVAVYPEGYARVDPDVLMAASPTLARRALAAILLCIGGQAYAPRGPQLVRLHSAIKGGTAGAGRTLGGCRIMPWRRGLLICREADAARDRLALTPGRPLMWDGRFRILAKKGAGGDGLVVARLGRSGWAQAVAAAPELRDCAIPPPARPSLPAFFIEDRLWSVPHLGGPGQGRFAGSIAFSPPHRLAGAGFKVA